MQEQSGEFKKDVEKNRYVLVSNYVSEKKLIL